MNLLLSIIVSALIDTATISIGEQTEVHLSAITSPQTPVEMPKIGDQLADGLEVVRITPVTNRPTDDGRQQYSQTLTITSFEDSLYCIEPFVFVSGADTFYTQPLSLNVMLPDDSILNLPAHVNPTLLTVPESKDKDRSHFSWQTVLLWVGIALLIVFLALIGYWGYLRYRAQRVLNVPAAPKRPAHEIALEKLEDIRQKRIWVSGQTKQYYTVLTDVLREYIHNQYGITSSEKTSDETLRALQPLVTDKEVYRTIQSILQLADMVKFAKWTTVIAEDEKALSMAFEFVQQTIPATVNLSEESAQ